jgi:hypothetical protein
VFNRVTGLKDNWATASGIKPDNSNHAVIDINKLLERISKCPDLSFDIQPHFAVSIEKTPKKFVAPLLKIIDSGSDQSPFIIISAAGAVGKSALASYISNQKNALLWDLGKQDLGDSVVKGTLLEIFGFKNTPNAVKLIEEGKLPVIVDAIDEAEIRSGESRIEKTIHEFATLVNHCKKPTIILLARTETAQYIKNILAENHLLKAVVPTYEIDFFDKEKSIEFLHSLVDDKVFKKPVVAEFIEKAGIAIANSLSISQQNPWGNEKFAAFMGYAPVLQATESLFINEKNPKKIIEEFSDKNWISNTKGSKFLSGLINLLLDREQAKLTTPLKDKFLTKNNSPTIDWGKIYDRDEQLSRLAARFFAGIDGYTSGSSNQLPQELKKEYETSVSAFISQHPFMRGSEFASSVFKDYLLAWSLKNPEFKQDAEAHIGQSPIMTPTLFTLYNEIQGISSTAHIGFLIDSFFSRGYGIESDSQAFVFQNEVNSIALMIWTGFKGGIPEKNTVIFNTSNETIKFGSKIRNTTIICKLDVSIGVSDHPLDINNTEIFAQNLIFNSKDINIRSREGSEHVLFSAEKFYFINPSATLSCPDKKRLGVISPNPLNYQLKGFEFSITGSSRFSSNKKISTAHENLIRIIRWFRKDKKQEFARYKDLIDNIAVGGDIERKSLIDFLKKLKIIQTRDSLYVMSSENINKYGLSWDANIANINPQLEMLLLEFVNSATPKP